ncbi:MAG TPA: recombinase family protein, partial [Candidatus Paceibacterota bacterium]|nr:recombinase family protein [Candidatus Paceibacterota bacterium]
MKSESQELQYLIYCRKSSEDSDKQILSIESQKRELNEYAERNGLNVVKRYSEERTAHKRGRPVFAQAMKDIETGKANAFLVWQPNRISRNAYDGGWVITLMDEGNIKEVRTPFKAYRDTGDDKFILQIEFGMAKKSSDDLRVNVKRGHYTKVLQGWRNGVAPLGYLNTKVAGKGENKIMDDPERYEVVQRILRLFLEGNYSVRQLLSETRKWGLKTRQFKRQGGKYLGTALMYRILTEPFYAGYFWANNPNSSEREFIKGAHNPMITLDEFDRIQVKLGRKGKPRPHNGHFMPFNGKMECGECGSMVTTDVKHQMICTKCKPQAKFSYRNTDACPRCETKIEAMENPIIVEYPYHTCSKKKGPCKQKAIKTAQLMEMIDKALVGFKVSDCFAQWALEELAKENVEKVQSQKTTIELQDERYQKVVAQLQNLVLLFTCPENANRELLTSEEYAPQRQALLAEKKTLEDARQNAGRKVDEWVDWAENSFDFATAARVWFENGTPEQRRN